MKLGLYADPHFSQSSSIIVGRKNDFAGRLDNLIQSFDWMNSLFKSKKVDKIVCLGDLTNKPILTAEEITAMSKCSIEEHYLIEGNHCRSDKDGKINSLAIYPNVIDEPQWLTNDVFCLPYNSSVFDLTTLERKPKIILSHNDIIGYDFGAGHISTVGYDIQDILDNCELYINGHLHTGGWVVKNRIINLGMLSGMNFSSCNGQWNPSVAILDTDTLDIEIIENPYAYKFRKESFNTLPKVKGYLDNLVGDNFVLQIKVPDTIADAARKLLDKNKKVTVSRLLVTHNKSKKSKKEQITFTENQSIYDKLKGFISNSNTKYSKELLLEIIDTISVNDIGVV